MKSQKRKSLSQHFFMVITLWTLVSVLLFIAVNFGLTYQSEQSRLTHELVAKQSQVSNLFNSELNTLAGYTSTLDHSNLISKAIQQRNTAMLTSYLPVILKKVRIYYPQLEALEVTDRAGFLIAYTDLQGNKNSARPRSPALRDALFTGQPQTKIDHIASSGQFVLEAAHPLKINNEIVGFIRTEASPKKFIANHANILGVDLVLVSRQVEIVHDPKTDTNTPKIKRKLVASSLVNWKSYLLIEMLENEQNKVIFEGNHYSFHTVPLKLEGQLLTESEVIVVFDQSNHPLLFSQQLIIFLSIGAFILVLLNLIVFSLIRQRIWTPLKHYSNVLNIMNNGEFDVLASATHKVSGKEFLMMETSIDQLSQRLSIITKGVRTTSNELNEQSTILKENCAQLTDALSQSANEIRDVSTAAREFEITLKEVPDRLIAVSRKLTDAALDSRYSITAASTIKRFADALKKSLAEFDNES